MPARKGLLAPQNTFLDTIATRFDGTHSNFVLGNAKIAKIYPIVYCSDGFCDLSGYSRAQIMQKSCACNFLYGQKTDPQHRDAISRALEQKKELKLEVILYKSSGTPFWCLLDIVPIQDEKHEVVLFLCSHKDITKQKLHEQQQHQLAQLHAQKQQQLLSNAAAAAAADHSSTSAGEQQAGHDISHQHHLQQQQQQQQVAADQSVGPQSGYDDSVKKRAAAAADSWGQNRKLEDADEAELTAMANQNALLSMDEFRLQDDSGADGADFEDVNSDSGDDHDKHTASQYSRRRSRAVLYQLSGHYGYRRSVNMKSKLKLNNRMNIPEYKTTTIEKQRFILSHYGVGKSCWDWLILVVSFYVAIVVPYNATFKDKHEDLLGGECKIDTIDMLVELVFLIDVVLNFRTTFVNRKGEVVTRPEIICKHYIRGWFVVDACAALPFDLLCSLNLYSRKMDRYSQYSYIILTLLMLIFSLLAHWCACIWYVIAMEEIAQNPSDWKIGWLHQLSDKLGRNVVNATDMAASYVTALYFTTSSLTSVGFGNVSANTNAEKIFSIVIMLIGALMHAVVFGNVTALIRVMYARRSNYQTRLRDLKDFFRLHQLPKELQQRMSDYFQTTWSLNHGIETYEILKDFPEELRGDVSLHLHREVLSLPIFETAPQGFLKSLARHIESKFCCPTEYLIHRGDALNYLYLVCNGSMEVLQDNMVVAILGKGDLVGYDVNALSLTPEHTQFGLSASTCQTTTLGGPKQLQPVASSLMTGNKLVKSSSDLKALTYCDLKCIQIAGLLEVLKLYPEFSDTFHREILHDLSFNLRENHDLDHDNMMNGHDEEDDDEDDDDDDDDDVHGGHNDHGGADEPPDNGSSNMNHLFRSIEQQQANQIGRYDYAEEDEDEVRQADEELIIDEQEEDEEEEEEDEEEEDQEDEEEDEEEKCDADMDGGDNNNPDDSDHGPGKGGSQATAPGEGTERAPGVRDGHIEGVGGKPDNEQDGQQRKGSGLAGQEQLTFPVALDQGLQENSRRRPMRAAHGDKHIAGRADGLGHSIGRTAKEADTVSWHSCDGLVNGPKSVVRLNGSGRQAKMMMMSKRNNSDGSNNNGGQDNVAYLQEPLVSGGGESGAAASRLKLSGSRQPQSGHSSRDRKPPIMFDLSRNTTVIVDRRRRSAGCIRPLLIGPAASAARRQTNYSSLTHISENPANDILGGSSSAASRGRSSRRHNYRTTGAGLPETIDGSKVLANTRLTYSSQDLKGLDTRISCLSTSVRELKQELQQELNQMRGTMQLFVRMVEKQQQQPLLRHSSGSLGQIAAADTSKGGQHSKVIRRRLTGNAHLPVASPKGNRSGAGVHRSKSAVSLPATSASTSTTSVFRSIGASKLAAGELREESDLDLLDGCDERQSIASEPAVPATNSLSIDSQPEQQAKSSTPITLAVVAGNGSGSSRAISQCSSSMSPPLLPTSSQPFASSNCLQTATNNQSDNDSGRSSTSMNSSSHHHHHGRQVLMVQSYNSPQPINDPVMIPYRSSPYEQQESQAHSNIRLVTKVLFTGVEGQRQSSGQKQFETIAAHHDDQGELLTAEATKSSLV